MSKRLKGSPVLIICTILFQALIIAIVSIEIITTDNTNALRNSLHFVAVINVIVSLLAAFSINEVMATARRSIEANLLKSHLSNINQLVQALRAERHEYARHLQTIQAMLYFDEYESSKEYIDGLAQGYNRHEGTLVVDEPLLYSLINSKQVFAESFGIDLVFDIRCGTRAFPLAPWDLCSVIGNLLDNALEAASSHPEGKRLVGMEISENHEQYLILVYNTGETIEEPDKIFKLGYTTKGSEGRGYGLYIVQRLVDNCGGQIEVSTTPRTTIKVILPKGGKANGQTA